MIIEGTGKKTAMQKGDFGCYRKRTKTIAFLRGRATLPTERLLFSKVTQPDDKIFLEVDSGTDTGVLVLFDLVSGVVGLDYEVVKDDEDCLLVAFN